VICNDADHTMRMSDVAVVEGRIAGVGVAEDLVARFGEPERQLDAAGRYVLPGLVNAHTHTFQSAFRGLGDGYQLREWMARLTQPSYGKISPEDAYWFTLLGCIENLRGGVTSIVNFQAYPNDLAACRLTARAVGEVGLRGLLVKSFYASGARPELISTRASVMDEVGVVFAELHGSYDGRVRFCVGPPSTLRAPGDWIVEVHALAAAHGEGLHMHIAEVSEDTTDAIASLGCTEIEYLASLGVVDSRFQAAHCVAITAGDMATLARLRATAVHNPVSNMYLASGAMDTPAMLTAGVNVALGSDGPASNNNQDMFAVMKATALMQRLVRQDAAAMPPGIVFELATRGGATAAGIDAGSIESGRLADLAIVDLSGVHNQPLHRPVSALVHTARPEDVESVVVDGRVVLDHRRIVDVDEAEIMEEARSRAQRVVAEAGIADLVHQGWPWT
jgi:5-methylthioadenosine/S-adenosylhomocysteine deaminase